MSDALDGKRAIKLGTKEVQKRLADGTAYLDVVVKGHWEREVDFGNVAHWYCSECHKEGKETDFCPFCGADLRDGDYDCMACAHDGDSNICLECEDGSRYLRM